MNNRKLLQKIIDELKKDKPDLSYIRGILETMIESLPDDKVIWNPEKEQLVVSNHLKGELKDEGAMLEAEAKAKLKNIDKNAIQNG